ncbi:MAG: spore coat protein [Firmicutes bacterium HGW-Firmicutes-12]|nr:MAG: spore coat protein [Firmicutes bacterium HGW-Firmicutes-12]
MVITTSQADVSGDGVLDIVSLTGEKHETSDIFIKDITLVVTDGKTGQIASTTFSNNAGYNPRLFIGDFTCDGVGEILISIDSGGSGGFGYYYIYSYRNNLLRQLFSAEDFNEAYKYKVIFRDGCKIAVYSEYFKKMYIIDVRSRKAFYQEQGVYDRNCRLLKPTEGFVPGLNNLYPLVSNRPNCYNLLVLQRVIGLFGADTVGYLETTLEWDETRFAGKSERVRPIHLIVKNTSP